MKTQRAKDERTDDQKYGDMFESWFKEYCVVCLMVASIVSVIVLKMR